VPSPRDGRPPLRVGLLLDALVQPAWVYHALAEILASGCARFAVVVLNDGAAEGSAPRRRGLLGLWDRLGSYLRYGLYALYTRRDARTALWEPDALRPRDLGPLLDGCPVLRVRPIRKKHSDSFPSEDIATLASYDLDVALRFGFRILRGDVLRLPRHGVWSYHHGDNRRYRGGPPGFWEVMEGYPVTGCVLQRLSEELDGGEVLCRYQGSTDRLSVVRNRNRLYWASVPLARRALEALHRDGEPPRSGTYEAYSERLYTTPQGLEILPNLVALETRRLAKRLEERFYTDQWSIAYRLRRGASGVAEAFHGFKELTPPPDRFWADPFPARWKDGYVIFVEEFLYATGKAHIAAIPIDPEGKPGTPFTVLEREYHLSYPFVFEWEGARYMIPETRSVRRVELYRAEVFPSEWRLHSVLFSDIDLADTTIAAIGDRYWMFASEGGPGQAEMHLFHGPSPLGPWEPHVRSPFKWDCRGARPAGKIFEKAGRLYRPAQDCSLEYGHSIVIHRIDRIDVTAYEETEVSRILPRWAPGLRRTHTINHVGELTVVDAARRVRRHRDTTRAPFGAAVAQEPKTPALVTAGVACRDQR
jgi:hypothetical protein